MASARAASRSGSAITSSRSAAAAVCACTVSERYADQNERDYDEFISAIKDGRLTATEGV